MHPEKVYLSEEEDKIVRLYAAADRRSVSNLLRHAVAGHINRSKKKDKNGEIFKFPEQEA